jgi:hypothetical protein
MLAITGVTIAAAALTAKLIDLIQDRMFVRRCPVSSALFEVAWAALLLRQSDDGVIEPYWASEAINSLHYAAKSVGVGLPRLVPIADLSARAIVYRRLVSASHALDHFTYDILLGDQDSRAQVHGQLVNAATALLTQCYSKLPKTSEEQEALRRQELVKAIRRQSGRVAWQVLVGLLPIAALSALRLTPLELPPETAATLTTLSIGWLLIKLISLIDPNYRGTLTDANEISAKMRGGSSA